MLFPPFTNPLLTRILVRMLKEVNPVGVHPDPLHTLRKPDAMATAGDLKASF